MKLDPNKPLSELKHQAKFVQWAREQGIKVCAIAQSTFTDSWKAINQNRMAGVVKGLPDLVLVIPPKLRENNQGQILFIEMKKEKGGVTSPEQKIWIADLNSCNGVVAQVCKGHQEAIDFTKQFIETPPPPPTEEQLEAIINNL